MRSGHKRQAAAAFAVAILTMSVGAPGAFAASDSPSPTATPLSTIKVGYQPNMGPGALLSVGIDQGYFAKQSLQVDPVRFPSGPPLVSALSAGQLDIGYIGPGAAFNAMAGAATVITMDVIGKSDVVLARAGAGITKPADLVGKKVLVPQGTSAEMILRVGLKNANVPYTSITPLASAVDAATAAFAAGQADAIATFSPYADQLMKAGNLVPVISDNPANPNPITSPTMVGLWLANKDFLAKNPTAVAAFLRAHLDANQYRYDHLQQIVPAVSKFTDVPADNLTSSIPTLTFLPSDQLRADVTGTQLSTWLEGLNQVLLDMGAIKQIVPVDQYFPRAQIAGMYTTPTTAKVTVKHDNGVPVGLIVGIIAAVIVVGGAGVLVKRRLS